MIFVPLLQRRMNLWMATRLTALAMTDYHGIVRDAAIGVPDNLPVGHPYQ